MMHSRPLRGDRKGPSLWIKLAALSVSCAAPVYFFALFSGFTKVVEFCERDPAGGEGRVDYVTQSAFPPSTVCHWKDGTTLDLVPTWANIVLLACAALFIGAVAGGIRAGWKRRANR
ncbi:hypothetical protein ACWEJ7_20220 [Streptomyces albidoflavus]